MIIIYFCQGKTLLPNQFNNRYDLQTGDKAQEQNYSKRSKNEIKYTYAP